MTLSRFAVLALLLCAGCGSDRVCFGRPCPAQTVACRDYVACYEKTGGTPGSLDSSYGPAGSCWATNSSALEACDAACRSAIVSLRTTFPDAGCL